MNRASVQELEQRVLLSSAGLTAQRIGAAALPGAVDYSKGIYAIGGGGSNIGGTADQFNFVSQDFTGDGSVIARVRAVRGGKTARAGVMIRDDSSPGSPFAGIFLMPRKRVEFMSRANDGASAIGFQARSRRARFLKLARSGDQLTGYYSRNGSDWTQIASSQTVAMDSSNLAGLAASTVKDAKRTTAKLADVAILPAGWTDTDIGNPKLAGSASYDAPSDTYSITGGGADIWGTSDQFNFASTQMTGDGAIAAYVNSMTNTNPWAKAGVMVRADSSSGSPFAAVLVSPTNGITFEWRDSSGDAAQQEISAPSGGPIGAPVGLKLARQGNSFTAYYSTDGINWLQIGPSQSANVADSALAGLAVSSHDANALCAASFSSVGVGSQLAPGAGIYSAADQAFLDDLEKREVMFFYDEANPLTGLVPDNASANGGGASNNSSIAAIGFGLTSLVIGDSRGWLTDSQAYNRALTTVNFLYEHGSNVNGFFYHFLNYFSGQRDGASEVSSIDTAELMAGVLTVAQYWPGTPLQTNALAMFDRVNWPWMQQSSGIFYGAWTPESGFSGGYGDFSEAALLYMLAMGSPTHPTTQASWNAWSRTPVRSYGGYNYVTADDGALFTVQYPQAWFDLRGQTDSHGLNYFVNAQNATLAQRQYGINLSSNFPDYGPNVWGLTPAQGVNGYTIWGGPPANVPIDGTIIPTAPGGSLEFTPRYSVDALEYMKQTYPAEYQKYGLVDAFNPLTGWSSPMVLGIDVGMTVVSAENSRSNLIWNLFSQSSIAQQAMAKAFPGTIPVWQVESGDWNNANNWTTGVIPNSAGAEANFYGAIGSPHTVYSDVPITAGTLNFNNANSYVLAGAGSLTLQALSGNAQIIVQQGTQTINLPLIISSDTVFNVAPGATLIIADPVTLEGASTITTVGGGNVIYQSTTTRD